MRSVPRVKPQESDIQDSPIGEGGSRGLSVKKEAQVDKTLEEHNSLKAERV